MGTPAALVEQPKGIDWKRYLDGRDAAHEGLGILARNRVGRWHGENQTAALFLAPREGAANP
jgi:hypothetical protein